MSNSKKTNTPKVLEALSQMIDVMKVQVSNSLVEKSNDLNLDRDSLKKINFIVTEVITNSYVNSVENVIKAAKSK